MVPLVPNPESSDEPARQPRPAKAGGISLLQSLFTSAELSFLKAVRRKDRRHPWRRLFFPNEEDTAFIDNTSQALGLIFERDKGWIERKKRQLRSVESFEAASSLLGEIRAYGSLLSVGLETRSGKVGSKSEPDFLVENHVFVEVHTKQSEPNEACALDRFNQGSKLTTSDSTGIHANSPFGAPNRDDSVTRIAIQKLAQIKQKEEEVKNQFSALNPSILWLDFQDETWNGIIDASFAKPLTVWNEEYYSGPLWYAFYGWTGAPVFQGETKLQRPRRTVTRMEHDGRFRRGTKIDAVVASLPRDTIILENPSSQQPIQSWIGDKLGSLPNFNSDYSFVDWPNGNLSARVASQKASLEALAVEAIFGW
ncbi:MAG TPA: hypothetical protein VJU86_14135 [Pyrinomonadaceae bacterium]|nr:hypothetical protein [Pyrinomonadaceae bacterium]